MSEEANMLVKDRTRLKVEAEVGPRRKKKLIGGMGENGIFVRTGHGFPRVKPSHSAHDDQPRSLRK